MLLVVTFFMAHSNYVIGEKPHRSLDGEGMGLLLFIQHRALNDLIVFGIMHHIVLVVKYG